jgi:hypothetical protein
VRGGVDLAGPEQRRRQVGGDHVRARAGRAYGHVAGAGGDVEYVLALVDAARGDQPLAQRCEQLPRDPRVVAERPHLPLRLLELVERQPLDDLGPAASSARALSRGTGATGSSLVRPVVDRWSCRHRGHPVSQHAPVPGPCPPVSLAVLLAVFRPVFFAVFLPGESTRLH